MVVQGASSGESAMAIVVEATYENGVLKPAQPLPLDEHEKVRVTIEPEVSWVDRTYGILGWTGDPSDLRYLAEDVDLDPQEGP
jgi:predicted DNA-binding antitoxin AbrB/MazE fold protein